MLQLADVPVQQLCVITVLTDNFVPLHSRIVPKLIYSMTGGLWKQAIPHWFVSKSL